MKEKIKKWLGIETLEYNVKQIQETIYDRDSMNIGFAIPKIVEKETILFAGRQKKVN